MCTCNTCPFAYSDESEQVQNWGCLPTPQEIVTMRAVHGKTWACHSQPDKPCTGAIQALQSKNLPFKVIDQTLITESDLWDEFTKPLT